MKSYIAESEVHALQEHFDRDATIAYRDVSNSLLSLARHYGGTTVNGKHFVYFPETDELIRDDVLAFLHKRRKDALQEVAHLSQQLGLYD